jgi:hypothetical protein
MPVASCQPKTNLWRVTTSNRRRPSINGPSCPPYDDPTACQLRNKMTRKQIRWLIALAIFWATLTVWFVVTGMH